MFRANQRKLDGLLFPGLVRFRRKVARNDYLRAFGQGRPVLQHHNTVMYSTANVHTVIIGGLTRGIKIGRDLENDVDGCFQSQQLRRRRPDQFRPILRLVTIAESELLHFTLMVLQQAVRR